MPQHTKTPFHAASFFGIYKRADCLVRIRTLIDTTFYSFRVYPPQESGTLSDSKEHAFTDSRITHALVVEQTSWYASSSIASLRNLITHKNMSNTYRLPRFS